MSRRVHKFVVAVGAAVIAVAVVGAQTPTPKPPVPAPAQTPAPVKAAVAATVTASIQAIDSKTRVVTLKTTEGTLVSIECGPEVQRFNELKVGDTVTFRYYESVVFAISAPGAPPPPAPATGVVRSAGERPAAAMAQQVTAVVTVLAIDAAVPSMTIQKQDGGKMSFKVENPKNIVGVKVGDKVQITYTQALAISVK